MSVEIGLHEINIHVIDDIATQQQLKELGFDREQLESMHEGLSCYYWVDRHFAKELDISGKSFILCVDATGRAVHFRNGYLYVSFGVRPENRE